MLIFNENSNTFTSSLFPHTVVHGFGTRMSGNGRDTKDIQKYLDTYKINYSNIADPEQVHDDRINQVHTDTKEKVVNIEGCDGLITQDGGVVLTVITADCAPIIYSDVKKHTVGISHNGRKGTELKLAVKMIERLQATGSKLQDIRVAIGPAIGACCYPMNLVKENFEQLIESGLRKDQIDFLPFCTKCDSKRFFSYRNSRNTPNFPEQFSFVERFL